MKKDTAPEVTCYEMLIGHHNSTVLESPICPTCMRHFVFAIADSDNFIHTFRALFQQQQQQQRSLSFFVSYSVATVAVAANQWFVRFNAECWRKWME